mmetsp:Transcript_6426/g.20591  ORF Transcript_6426/g.20591 Transcript_6426/m.20591 type:complete len:247 (-) Transcript_6426:589-1329(-)
MEMPPPATPSLLWYRSRPPSGPSPASAASAGRFCDCEASPFEAEKGKIFSLARMETAYSAVCASCATCGLPVFSSIATFCRIVAPPLRRSQAATASILPVIPRTVDHMSSSVAAIARTSTCRSPIVAPPRTRMNLGAHSSRTASTNAAQAFLHSATDASAQYMRSPLAPTTSATIDALQTASSFCGATQPSKNRACATASKHSCFKAPSKVAFVVGPPEPRRCCKAALRSQDVAVAIRVGERNVSG